MVFNGYFRKKISSQMLDMILNTCLVLCHFNTQSIYISAKGPDLAEHILVFGISREFSVYVNGCLYIANNSGKV